MSALEDCDSRHGTTRGYHAGCRLACCRKAMARYEKEGRLARLRGGRAVPAIGAQRRLQALMRLGWSSHAIAVEAGVAHRNHVWRIVNGQKGKPTIWIQRETDVWVREVYERLSMRLPEGHFAARTRAHAEQNEWLPPLAWIDIDDPNERPDLTVRDIDPDPVVVTRILAGDWGLQANRAERLEVIRRWPGSDGELERRTGWNVARDRRLASRVAHGGEEVA